MRRSDHAGSMKPRRGRSRSAGHFGAKIIVTDHGPFRVVGDVAICNPEGTLLRHSATSCLCRCGGSRNKPFGDGTHSLTGCCHRVAGGPAAYRHAGGVVDHRRLRPRLPGAALPRRRVLVRAPDHGTQGRQLRVLGPLVGASAHSPVTSSHRATAAWWSPSRRPGVFTAKAPCSTMNTFGWTSATRARRRGGLCVMPCRSTITTRRPADGCHRLRACTRWRSVSAPAARSQVANAPRRVRGGDRMVRTAAGACEVTAVHHFRFRPGDVDVVQSPDGLGAQGRGQSRAMVQACPPVASNEPLDGVWMHTHRYVTCRWVSELASEVFEDQELGE
jgi:CDGSH-type Zn-finger protein